MPYFWRTLAAVCLAPLCAAFARSAEPAAFPPLPAFTGYLSAPKDGTLFVLRWSPPQGGSFESWVRLGERAGEYKLVEFDAKTETLAVADSQGRLHRLALPGSTVRPPEVAEMADEEFADLVRYSFPGADRSAAPVLSWEKARAFYLRYVMRPSAPTDVEVVIDLDGRTLPPPMAARWPEMRAQERAGGGLMIAAQVNGQTSYHVFPVRPYPSIPGQLLRNLTEADWEEIGLLDAINSIKRRHARGEKP